MKTFLLLLLGVSLVVGTPTISVPFATKLFFEIVHKHTENVIFSPASIKSCLGLAYMGAEGATATELYNVLQLSGNDKQQVGGHFADYMKKFRGTHIDMKTANRIYLGKQFTIAPTFNELVSKYLDAKAENVDFADSTGAAAKINTWIESQTNKKIQNLIMPEAIDASTTVILVNAIYFKATWRYAFKQQKTKELPFHMSASHAKTVMMMHETMEIRYGELPEMKAKAVELAYADTDISMLIILPDEIEGLFALEEHLKEIDLTHFDLRSERVNLKLPKFKIEFSLNLNDVLEKLGLGHLFHDADFSGLISSGGNDLSVSSVQHKAFIEVDEHGTEAAAATSITMSRSFPAPRQLSFDFFVDHPFFFAIKDSDTVYFAGHITKF